MARMNEDACRLSDHQRRIVEQAIAEHCRFRGWTLHASNCRTNHLHVVVTASLHPDDVRSRLKAWCSRRLNELSPDATRRRTRWWTERGSKRFLNTEESLEAAILYVRDGQDRPR